MNVLLVDDHPLILAALRAVIASFGNDDRVTCAESARQARECLHEHPDLDLVLLDLTLGDAHGFDLLAEIRRDHPQVPVVVLSASQSKADVLQSLDMGAMGYVSKRSSNEALVEALRDVLSGGLHVPRDLFGTGEAGASGGSRALSGGLVAASLLERLGLTARQGDVLAGILRGLPNKLIARELSLSTETVKAHVAAVLRSLNVSTRTQAIVAVTHMQQERLQGFSWRRGLHA
jgi:DNA-binding NarL/FixJ family response regulator